MIDAKIIHFIGLLDPDMLGVALIAKKQNCVVAGSDDRYRPQARQMVENAGIPFFNNFDKENVNKHADLVVLSRYFDATNVEAIQAQKYGAKIITVHEMLAQIMSDKDLIGVIGSYGKTTIAALARRILSAGKLKFTYDLGGYEIEPDGTSIVADWSDEPLALWPLSNFKQDATTYVPDFATQPVQTAVISSIAFDHPELYNSADDVYEAYAKFARHMPRNGLIIGNGDNLWMKRLRGYLADRTIETYGFDYDATWRINIDEQSENSTMFKLKHAMGIIGPFTVPTVEPIHLQACAAAILIGQSQEVKLSTMQTCLETLPQLYRHLETKIGQESRVIIDDCADHPDTIEMTLKQVRAKYPKARIWCLYRPGSYLRVKSLQKEYIEVLSLADSVVWTDIVGYPKEKSEGLHSRHVVAEMRQTARDTMYVESLTEAQELLAERARKDDVIITLGDETVRQVWLGLA